VSTALRIYGPAREWCKYSYDAFEDNPYHPRVAEKVVGLAFLSMVAAWEEFIEELFIRYLSGAASEAQFAPRPMIGLCKSRGHSLQVLSALAKPHDAHLRWADMAWVKDLASIYFEDGAPFWLISGRFEERLKDAQVIRNRVAHHSRKARLRFKRIANKLRGAPDTAPLPTGYSPGLLLTEDPTGAFDTAWVQQQSSDDLFVAFAHMYLALADLLAP